jgi:hypothetical protein
MAAFSGGLALLFCIGLPVSLLISRKRRAEDAKGATEDKRRTDAYGFGVNFSIKALTYFW